MDKGEIDHFRPTSKFPHLVYEWSNWIFACHTCNHNKSAKWPNGGYINPCADDESEQPECFFDFNIESKRLIPRKGISSENVARACQMVTDLDLNGSYHIRKREERLYLIESRLDGLIEDSEEEQEFLERITARNFSLSSIIRKMLQEQGFEIDG